MKSKISIIGSGNWGSVVANIIATNVLKFPQFQQKVQMWVYPEKVNNESLIDIINNRHENIKYLPGIKLRTNLVATSDLTECTKDADFIVFVLPHQFLDRLCKQMKPHLKKSAMAISFTKGIFCSSNNIELISQHLKRALEIPVCAVSGANVANEVALNKFAEATLGFDSGTVPLDTVRVMQRLFSTPTLRITPVDDVAGVEISGALKNVIALAAGFVDGLDMGSNTKAAILRLGMAEIQKFGLEFFENIKSDTFWQSSGFADLITTCYAGRNRKCAEEFVRSGDDWDVIEKRLLNGQKMQGHSTCSEVYEFLKSRGRLGGYPLIRQIHRVSFGTDDGKVLAESIIDCLVDQSFPEIVLHNDKKENGNKPQ